MKVKTEEKPQVRRSPTELKGWRNEAHLKARKSTAEVLVQPEGWLSQVEPREGGAEVE